MSAAGDDGFVLFQKTAARMRAVVTACGHGGIVSEGEHAATRGTTTAATSALQPEGFGFYVLRVQGDTHSPGLSWSSASGLPTNFSQYNPEIVLLLNNPEIQSLLMGGDLTQLAGIIGGKIREIDIKSGVVYGSTTEKDTHPPEIVRAEDFYVTYTPQNPPREDYRLIATYAEQGELLRWSVDSYAQLPRREAASGGMENKRLFKSYGLFFVDSTDEVDKRAWCLTSAGINLIRADKKVKTKEHRELEHEKRYNLFGSDNIARVVHLIGWRNGFFLRKETGGGVWL